MSAPRIRQFGTSAEHDGRRTRRPVRSAVDVLPQARVVLPTSSMASATIIDVPTLPVKEQLKIVALQGDWPLHIDHSAEGGRYVVATPARAKDACLRLVEHARDAHAHLALVPELAIPLSAVEAVIDRIRALTESLVFVGGLEGCSLNSYRDLVQRHGGAPDIPPKGHGTYVNAMMIVSHTPEGDTVSFRAKRFASGPENALGPQMTDGAGPFLILRLGSLPFTVLPLICSEFVWPIVWDTLTTEAPKLDIDVIPVLQRNHDPSRKHLSPILYGHYQKGAQTRFVMVNHSLAPDKSSDGSCYVFLPPGSPAAPGFDHGREELWLDGDNYKGFRIPDRTGCFWEATVVHRSGPTGATKPPLCSGRVLQVLLPPSDDLSGLPAGLLRSAAAETLLEAGASIPLPDSPKEAYLRALDRTSASHLLHGGT